MKKLLWLASLILVGGIANAADSTYQDAMQKAGKSIEAKDYSAARKAFEAAQVAATTSDEKINALFNVGKTYEEEGNRAKAREVWQQLVVMKDVTDDQKLAAQMSIGGSYLAERHFAEARAAFPNAFTNPAANTGVLGLVRVTIAGSYKDEGKPDLARAEFAQIAADPTVEPSVQFFAQQEIGEMAFSNNNFALARAEFTKSAQIKGISVAAKAGSVARIVETYRREGDNNQAETVKSESQTLLTKRAIDLSTDNKHAESRLYYEAALILANDNNNPAFTAMIRVKIADTYLSEGNAKSARKELDVAQSVLTQFGNKDVDPGIASQIESVKQAIQLSTAISYYVEGQKQRATQEYEKTLKMPDLNGGIRSLAERDLAKLKAMK